MESNELQAFVQRIRQELTTLADEKTRISGERFFKEKVKIYGLKTVLARKLSKAYYQEISYLPKNEIFDLCEELWKSGYVEESFFACDWSLNQRKNYQPEDFDIFEHWVANYVSNWASCDTLCNHTIGEFLMKFPDFVSRLKTWSKSPNLWMRRAAAVSLIIPARKGLFISDIFEIATLLLTDREDLVQKGYGWMLKAADNAHRPLVFDFVMKNKATMPRTALRYAIEKMPPDLKAVAMAK